MAYDLVETPVFSAPLTVPEGDDDMHDAAEIVAALALTLANRTQALKAVTDQAARVDTPQTFAGTQTFDHIEANSIHSVGLVQSGGILLGSQVQSTHDVTAANSMSAGVDVNAARDITAQRDIRAVRNLTCEGLFNADYAGVATLNANTQIVAPLATLGAVNASGEVHSAAKVTAPSLESSGAISLPGSSRITYSGSDANRYRYKTIAMCKGIYSGGLTSAGFNGINWYNASAGSGGAVIVFPIELPTLAVVTEVWAIRAQPSHADTFSLTERAFAWSGDGASTSTPTTSVKGTNPGFAGAGLQSAKLAISPNVTVDNALRELIVVYTLAVGSSLYALRVGFYDPGPRND